MHLSTFWTLPMLSSSKPAPRLYRPGATNLRSSAFICGSYFVEVPDSKGSDGINRMDRINPSANPVNPVHPVQSGSSFSEAPDINCYEIIKLIDPSLRPLRSLWWCSC